MVKRNKNKEGIDALKKSIEKKNKKIKNRMDIIERNKKFEIKKNKIKINKHNTINKKEKNTRSDKLKNKKVSSYELRKKDKTKENISKVINLLKETESKESISNDEFVDSHEWSDNTINESELIEAKIDDNVIDEFSNHFFRFISNINTLKFLLWTKNNIITSKNYKSFAFKSLKESIIKIKIEKIIPEIFNNLYQDIKYFKITKIDSYFDNYFYKWSIFFKDEIDESNDVNLYFHKEDSIKRLNKIHKKHFIDNKDLYNYVMSKIMPFYKKDKKWETYYYYLFLIPKNILFTYYLILKERDGKYMCILSDIKEFITLVLRCGGVKPYCRLVDKMFIKDFENNFGYLKNIK
jgi:hypothetical protein